VFKDTPEPLATLARFPGVNLNARDTHGRTPLIWAAQWGNAAIVSYLTSVPSVDVGAVGHDGLSALAWATEGGFPAVAATIAAALQSGRRRALSFAGEGPPVYVCVYRLFWLLSAGERITAGIRIVRGSVLVLLCECRCARLFDSAC
jgi:hypothetical protein